MADSEEYLIIGFSPGSLPIQKRWRNNGLSADFIADYWGTFFPAYDEESQERHNEIKSAVAYIANELLENAMKFSYSKSDSPICIKLNLFQDELRFYISNSVHHRSVGQFQAFIRRLLTEDPGELYIRQLEANAGAEDGGESRLGFLTMLNDYHVQLAWNFDILQEDPAQSIVTTMVQLPL